MDRHLASRTAILLSSFIAVLATDALAVPAPPIWAPEHPRCRLLGDEALINPRAPEANVRSRADRAAGAAGDLARGTFEGCPHDYDVLHYDINFSAIELATISLTGNTNVRLESQVDALSSIDLDLTSSMAVSSVLLDSITPLTFSHAADVLNIDFGLAAPDSGDTVSVDIFYSGPPTNEGAGGFGGFWFAIPYTAYSMGVGLNADPPSMARSWFPSYDWPCDKATVALSATTDFNKIVVSNGLLTSVDSTATNHTYHWEHDFPTSTYLIAMSVARYRIMPDTIITDPRIQVYHHPGMEAASAVSFQNVDLMMQALEGYFGPYPFDKFAFMTTPLGDMEHQTCVSHARTLVDGTNNYDDILAHEMAHQWFGDCVTYGDWRDVWLSEGFATYGEALFREFQNGTAAYHEYVTEALFGRVIASGETDGVYAAANKWGPASYEKGGSVLHMLRGILDNDPLFLQVLRDYHTNFAYGNAITTDFIASASATAGQDLSWFFTPWAFGEGHPVYQYGWSYEDIGGGQYRVDVGVRQVQTTASLFDMPVDFRVQTAGGDFDFSERIDLADQLVSFVVTGEPTGLILDPDDWILDVQQLAPTSVDFGAEIAQLQAFRLEIPRPNPFALRTEIRYYVPASGPVSISIHDVTGRRVRELDQRIEQAGPRSITWDRRDDTGGKVGAGVYFVRVEAAGQQLSRKVVVID